MNKTSEDDILRYLRTIPKTKIKAGESLIELTTYSNIAMWWFAESKFYLFINRILNDNFANKPRRTKFPFVFHKTIEIYLDISRIILIRLIMNLYGKKKNTQSDENKVPKILFTAQDIEWRVIRDYETNSMKKSDAFFDSIIKKLGGKCKLVGIYPINPSIHSLRIFIDKLKNWYIPHRPFDLYWSLSVWKKEKEAFKYFKEVWETLKDDETFKELCIYNGKNLYNPVRTKFESYFNILFPRAVKHIEIAKRMIEKEKPDLNLIVNEYGDFERALVIAGKQRGVSTMAVQHGVFTPTKIEYIFNKEEKGKVILPDITCVFGQYYYDLLTKNSIYEPEQVVVTGQPRYDVLYHADKLYSKEKFLKRYNVNPKHKIVLWTTQCHGISEEENKKNFKAVFEMMHNIKNATLIIKQHPGEGGEYTKMIKKFLNKYKINAVITPKSSDTYEQIFACDLMITRHSTTAIEAVALNKPVIILNLSGEPDLVEYVKESVALGVYDEKDLKATIEKLLKDDSELAKNRAKYIEKYLYKIDGKATERVVRLIEKMIKERRKNEI
jgi:UDP-N-acetylglucosamine 2-epimerase